MNVRIGVPLLLAGVLLAVVAGLASGVAAQGAAWRIVHASDGTVYLLRDGARYAIVGDDIGDDELAEYTDGEPIGSALSLLSALQPTPQAPAAHVVTQPAAPETAPAEGLAEPQAVQPAGDAGPADGAAGNTAPQTAAPTRGAAPAQGKQRAVGPPPTQPSSDLQFLSVQGNTPGQPVSVSVQAPEGSTCSLDYLTPTRVHSTAAGLGPQTVGASRTVTWSFLLDAAIRSGNGTVTVTCGQASISRSIAISGLSK